jgi:hypothetical protein
MHKISFIGNGSQCEFAFAFPIFQPADVRAAINEEVVPNNGYNVFANADLIGGNVVFANPPATDAKIDIFRKIKLDRFIDYQPAAKIDPEKLNADFNFLLEAFRDMEYVDIDLAEWKNVHDNILTIIQQTHDLITDKLSGGGALGVYNNLVSVLSNALPLLINDYGSIAEPAPNENADDYGSL